MSFKDKVCWVTGASSGIGQGLALALAAQGAKVVLSARKVADLEQVKAQCPNADNALVLPMDMLDTDQFPKYVAQVVAHFGGIHYVFQNAGMSQRGMLLESPFSVDRAVMELNFMSVVALTKAILPIMVAQKEGYFGVTSSVAGKIGTPMRSAYCASKHALHGYFDSLRAELWPHNIGVTIFCPGYIKTDISLNAISANGQTFGKMDSNQANGMTVEECVGQMLKAVKAQKREVYIGGKEILGIYLKRFFPALLARIVKNYQIETV
jgi:short-subunit dehydrogenase